MANPLDNVDLTKDFHLSSQDVAASAEKVEEEDREETQIEQPFLEKKHLLDLAELQLILSQQSLANRVATRQFDTQQKAIERDLQLEARLEPINLGDLIIKGEITQEIPIDPENLVITLRTLTHEGVVIAEKVGKELANERAGGKSSIAPEHIRAATANVAQLVQSLIRINRETGPGVYLAEITEYSALEAAVKKETEQWLKKNHQLLEQLTNQYLNFVARVRNVLNHAGYVEQEVKK